jgi:hypothetical protein
VPSVPPYNGSGKAAGPGPAVKPFIQSVTSADPLTKTPAQAQMFTATPPASHLVAPTVQAQGQRQKMLAWMAIVLATLFIVMLLLLVFLHHR